MGLHYPAVQPVVLVGTKTGTTRTPVALATTYTVEKALAVGGYSKINLDILYTMGAAETANSIEIKLEGSPDGTNWYRIPNESVSGGTSTLTAREFTFVGADAAAATISIGIDIFYKWLKVSAKESGVAANAGSVYIEATLSGK